MRAVESVSRRFRAPQRDSAHPITSFSPPFALKYAAHAAREHVAPTPCVRAICFVLNICESSLHACELI